MVQLTDLPPEILIMIVFQADTLHEKETGLDIFNIMRVNWILCNITIRIQLKVKNFDRPKTVARMLQHEQCYVNHARQVEWATKKACRLESLYCYDDVELLPTCPKGVLQTGVCGPFFACTGYWKRFQRVQEDGHHQSLHEHQHGSGAALSREV